MTLELLLGIVQEKFGDNGGPCYEFTLGRIGGKWCFHIINSWQNWMKMKHEDNFYSDSPAGAVAAFLRYVEERKIDVRSLTEKGR